MKKSKSIRSLLAGLPALLMLLQLAACASSSGDELPEVYTPEYSGNFIVYDGSETGFTLVESRDPSKEEEQLVNEFYKAADKKLLAVNESRTEVTYEIIVGKTKRETSAALAAEVAQLQSADAFHYAARIVGSKILFYSDAPEGYNYLRDYVKDHLMQDGRIIVPKTMDLLETVTWEEYERSPYRAAALEKEAAAAAREQEKTDDAAALEARLDAYAAEKLEKRAALRKSRTFTDGVYVYDFDDFSLEYDINYGGYQRAELSDGQNHTTGADGKNTAGQSVRMSSRSRNTAFELLDAFTDEDLGKTFEITAWVYNDTDSDTEISLNLVADTGKYESSAYMTSFQTVPKKTWTPLTMTYTHLEAPVTNLSIAQPASASKTASTIYVDDVTLKITGDKAYTVGLADTSGLPQERGDRKLVWGDGFENGNFDISKWFIDNRMTADDMRREFNPETMKIEDGLLKLRSSKFTSEQPDGKIYEVPHFPTTQGKMEFRYGYFEIRAKIPYHSGNSGAFWFCSTLKDEKKNSVEIDLVELLGSENNCVSNLHQWGTEHLTLNTSRLPRSARSHTFPTSGDVLSEEFHTYYMDWTPEYIAFGVDGHTYLKLDITESGNVNFNSKNVDMDVFHLPVYFILSEFLYTPARELGWGLKGGEDAFDWQMEVDYVAIYQKDGETLYVGDELLNR